MELKPGYKQTEVGVIPEDWFATTVGQMIANGLIEKPLDGNHGNIHPKSGDFVDSGIPFVMANNVQDGYVDLVNCSFIRKQQADSLQKGFARTGDVLLTHKATIGNTAIVGEIPFPYIMLTPQVTYYRVADKANLSNAYLRYYFDSAGFQSVLHALSGGGTRGYIGISAQHQLPVILPPNAAEQRAISSALSDMDRLLNGLERLIAKKRDLKQGAMQQLLTGQNRLPGFGTTKIEKRLSSFGKFPLDWQPRRLSEISAFITKGSTPTTYGFEWVRDGVLFLRSECVSEDGLDLSQAMFISFRAHRMLRRSEVAKKDILITITGNVGRVVLLGEDFCASNINQHIARIRIIDAQVSPEFIFHFLSQRLVREHFNQVTTGQAYPQISLKQVRDATLPIPSLPEQTAIAEVLSGMDAELEALEARLVKMRKLKQAMMQELLTGRTRLL